MLRWDLVEPDADVASSDGCAHPTESDPILSTATRPNETDEAAHSARHVLASMQLGVKCMHHKTVYLAKYNIRMGHGAASRALSGHEIFRAVSAMDLYAGLT